MPKRSLKRVPKKVDATPSLDYLTVALKKLPNDKLVEMVVKLASRDRELQRKLDKDLRVHAPEDQLVPQTRQAISDATFYDEGDCNTDFDYDDKAYDLIEKNF